MFDDDNSVALPTIEQCHEFMALVNKTRVAFDLPPLEKLDFDGAVPCRGNNCLSARNVFMPVLKREKALDSECPVGFTALNVASPETARKLRDVMGTGLAYEDSDRWVSIPAAIKTVTDPFDECVEGLRERLVEAGYVD